DPVHKLIDTPIAGDPGSGVVGINGAAAHLVHPGDLVIILSYVQLATAEARVHQPQVVHVDAGNRVIQLGQDAAQPAPGAVDQFDPRQATRV
ncbi:aspartate 1-decarboxylase, partial [Nesterenkonia sphaerica]